VIAVRARVPVRFSREPAKIRRKQLAVPSHGRSPRHHARGLAAFARQCVHGFIADRCLIGASALSYATIVSLVPLTAIVLAIFSGFSFFSGARDHFLIVLLENFAPAVGEQAAWWFQHLAMRAAETTAIGAAALVGTAILLLATIEDYLQIIWHVSAVRAWHKRVLAYWMVLTLGPVLLGIGFSLPSYFESLAQAAGSGAVMVEHTTAAWLVALARVLSFAIATIGFTLLYRFIPNCHVRWRDGIIGALVAAALMAVLKIAFGLFVSRLSTYGTVYGALAGIPIFLLWMYIFWAVVLFGAVVAARLRPRTEEDLR
jgi:membrane protein